jgi:LEA14-like dessication related protein
MSMHKWLFLGLMLGLLAGCTSLTKLQAPRLSIVSVGMKSADIFSQDFRIRLHVQNPNDRSLPVKSIEYELFLEGDSFAEGVSSDPFVVPALGETEFDTTVHTNFVSSIGRLLSRLNGTDATSVHYEFVGKVAIDLPFVRDIPFKDSGTVDFATKR